MSLEGGRPLPATADRGPLERRRARIFVAVAVVGVTALGSLGAGFGQPDARPFDVGALALLLATPLAIVFLLPRRPATAAASSIGVTGAYLLAGYPWGPAIAAPVVLLAAIILCGPARRGRLIAWAGSALLLGTIVTVATLSPPVFRGASWDGPPGRSGMWGPHGGPGEGGPLEPVVGLSSAGLVAGTAWLVVALLVAGAIRDRVARRAAARAAARASAAERERTAVTAERLRIARELHDVLAHSLSGINVQAGVGLHLLDRDPGQARTALTSIRDTSRDALAEVRTVLGIVRMEAGDVPVVADADRTRPPGNPGPPSSADMAAAPLAPTWDLSGLERLAAQTRAEGLSVTLEVDAPGLPDRIAGAVHRVVQEALTNIRRHAAGASRVAVSVRRSGTSCLVAVSDDGRGAPGTGGGGYGLRGMRERVEALGGTLEAGPDDVGWLVRASFPLPDAAPGHDAAPDHDAALDHDATSDHDAASGRDTDPAPDRDIGPAPGRDTTHQHRGDPA
ncbi:sensor histidine kinase [Myceligenerans pegani]|uniref:histidine kinase n=1 Tax=Myceligenerans pegani TaxID=2776917 RepID=A0ABR9N470_9MICO|nr:histidine kinase [Myceligenerans sp. TRM 65318]MBE1877971.1 sensor histidine kinase [Myceligenerans sp. TRM 65318]MBE3020242.1 sensor histidine kinase [Myceligenerans sp. TRM 65318]